MESARDETYTLASSNCFMAFDESIPLTASDTMDECYPLSGSETMVAPCERRPSDKWSARSRL